jgi:hypothetical protein
MQTYSIYIEYTNDTYEVIEVKAENEPEAEAKGIGYAILNHDEPIYFIEATPV